MRCQELKDASVQDRWQIVKEKNLCFSCLEAGHWSRECKDRRRCRVKGCDRWHDALLHEEKKSRQDPQRGKNRGTSRSSKDVQVVNSGGGQSAIDSGAEQMAVSTGTNAYIAAGKVALPIHSIHDYSALFSIQYGRAV